MIAVGSASWWIRATMLLLAPALAFWRPILRPGHFVNRRHRMIEMCAAAFIFIFFAAGIIINLIKN